MATYYFLDQVHLNADEALDTYTQTFSIQTTFSTHLHKSTCSLHDMMHTYIQSRQKQSSVKGDNSLQFPCRVTLPDEA